MTTNGNDTQQPRHKMLRLVKETKIDFLKFRPVALVISSVLVILGIIAVLQIFAFANANLGIEFTGGTQMTIVFENDVDIATARSTLLDNGFTSPQVTDGRTTDGYYQLHIKVKEETETDDVSDIPERIQRVIANAYPETDIRDSANMAIGPAVGNELKEKAIYAIIYAIIGIILYIAVRFDFKFGVAATAAMFHDVLAVIGIIWVVNFISPMEFTLLIMTAILTLAGYSLTDTVVVFDRIRENLKKSKKSSVENTVNLSINQVLSRTVVTSLTTLLVVTSIFILGGDVLHDFAFALLAGILIGTYSSIFVASPLLVAWQGGKSKLLGAEAKKKPQTSS